MDNTGIKTFTTENEDKNTVDLTNLLTNCPLPQDQLLSNLGLFLLSKNLSRILFMNHVYLLIVPVHGVVFDFGTRWGQNMAVFSALRGIYEPFNRHRKIVGFDTFEGFPAVGAEDGSSDLMRSGNVACTKDYDLYLNHIMQCHEKHNPSSHIKKFDVIKGDAVNSSKQYLEEHPETIVSLAYFDFDIYRPTKECLDIISDRLTKGSVVCFDELCCPDSPGETVAVQESIGINNIRIQRLPFVSRVCYYVVE